MTTWNGCRGGNRPVGDHGGTQSQQNSGDTILEFRGHHT